MPPGNNTQRMVPFIEKHKTNAKMCFYVYVNAKKIPQVCLLEQ